MSNFTIQDFWKPRLAVQKTPSGSLVQGWSFETEGLDTFKEAPLALNAELSSDVDPFRSPILLVSAPGAVGKSTLARQVAFLTGAVYIDLAKAEPVGGNTLSGGLVKSGLYAQWQATTTGVLIDGLDEARLRVTQEAFEAFLADVAQLARNRTVPTVLFGRTGAVQDAWLFLALADVNTPVLEIGYYGSDAAADFAEARLRRARPSNTHAATERRAIELILSRLREQTEVDGDRFAGYAPVLQAVADRVASEGNASALVAEIEAGAQPVTLNTVVSAILARERRKLETLRFHDARLLKTLYSPDEQLDRLVARVYRQPPPDLAVMGADDARLYDTALKTWVAEHPFLDGRDAPSSAVFDAVISVRALGRASSAEAALDRELRRGAAANPFLAEFYSPQERGADRGFLPPQHVGIVYASLRARLSLGDSASLLVEGPENALEEEALRAEVEITLGRRGSEQSRYLRFESEQTRPIRLGPQIEDVDISVPHTEVEIGLGSEALLIAPINIQCDKLAIASNKLIVESAPDRTDGAVFLEAASYDGGPMVSVPILRGDVSLSASWPGARSHPWTSFAVDPSPTDDPRVDEPLRRLRKFVVAFRSHSKGNLARYKAKIEHARMTKGSGQAVLNLLVAEKILSLAGNMYFLDPDRLASHAGTNYTDCMSRRFSAKTIEFVSRVL